MRIFPKTIALKARYTVFVPEPNETEMTVFNSEGEPECRIRYVRYAIDGKFHTVTET